MLFERVGLCTPQVTGWQRQRPVIRSIKEHADRDYFVSAQAIVSDALSGGICVGEAFPALPALKRTANRVRERKQQTDPKDLEFELDFDFMSSGRFIMCH